MSKYDDASLVQIPSGYKAGTLYSVLPANGDGDFDFTRASIATRVNAEGLIEQVASGVPRLDYPILNGVVQSCPALLLEPARTNVQLYSQEFDNAAWAKLNAGVGLVPVVTANYAISPDGTQNADRIQFSLGGGTTSADRSFIRQAIAAQTDYYLSFYVKSTDGSEQKLLWHTGGDDYQFTVTGEWQRVELSRNGSSIAYGGFSLRGGISTVNTADVLVYGFQAERGSYATSYIPTAGSTVARAAEVCNGAGTSAEFNDSEGVLFAEVSAFNDSSIWRGISISDGTPSNRVAYYATGRGNANEVRFDIIVAGIFQVLNYFVLNDITNSNKVAIKYKANDVGMWVNGFRLDLDTNATMPSGLSKIQFTNGSTSSPSENYYGKTKQLIAFDAALTDEQLEDLTSWDSFEELAASQGYLLY